MNRKECPQCGSKDITDKIRQYEDRPDVDVGWECEKCGWQWGFKLSEPSYKGEKP